MSSVTHRCRYCDKFGGHAAGCIVKKDDRIAQLEAELAEEHKKSAAAQGGIDAVCKALESERAAHARTQAEAAAMRPLLQSAMEAAGGNPALRDWRADLQRAISGDAGRAIAERVTKLEAVSAAADAFCKDSHYAKLARLRVALRGLAALDDKKETT